MWAPQLPAGLLSPKALPGAPAGAPLPAKAGAPSWMAPEPTLFVVDLMGLPKQEPAKVLFGFKSPLPLKAQAQAAPMAPAPAYKPVAKPADNGAAHIDVDVLALVGVIVWMASRD